MPAGSGAKYTGTGGSTDSCAWGVNCDAPTYWNNTKKKCETCLKGYYCQGNGVGNNNSTTDSGINPCPAGATTASTGKEYKEDCIMGGATGTKFCDAQGCFFLPVTLEYDPN
jgi:hypothetical protein